MKKDSEFSGIRIENCTFKNNGTDIHIEGDVDLIAKNNTHEGSKKVYEIIKQKVKNKKYFFFSLIAALAGLCTILNFLGINPFSKYKKRKYFSFYPRVLDMIKRYSSIYTKKQEEHWRVLLLYIKFQQKQNFGDSA